MNKHERLFINVEDALNFIEVHENQGDLHLYNITDEGRVQKKTGLDRLWTTLQHTIGIGDGKEVKRAIIENAVGHLREDFNAINNEKIKTAITDLENITGQNLDQLISQLRRFRVALRQDAEFKLKRLKVMVESSAQKIAKLKEVDRHWVPGHILDFLCEIDEELGMYEQERQILERGHKVYSSIIERSKEIDQEMEVVRQKHQERFANALNWAIILSLEEMSENGIPELLDISRGVQFEINENFIHYADKKYKQLRNLYLKHHSKLRMDLKGSFDNNFAEYEGRLYFIQQLIKNQKKEKT